MSRAKRSMNMSALTCCAAAARSPCSSISQSSEDSARARAASTWRCSASSAAASRASSSASRHSICCMQEIRWHRGVVLGLHRRAAQLAQVGGTPHRVLQALISLVDAHRPLHRQPLRGRALGGEAVRMRLALQRLPARVERRAVLREGRRHGEQLEIGVVEVHCKKMPPVWPAATFSLPSGNTVEPALPGHRCCPRPGVGEATRSARSLGASSGCSWGRA